MAFSKYHDQTCFHPGFTLLQFCGFMARFTICGWTLTTTIKDKCPIEIRKFPSQCNANNWYQPHLLQIVNDLDALFSRVTV